MPPLLKIFVISIFMLTSNIALGATETSASAGYLDLVVELNDPQDKDTVDRKIITFKSACQNFGNYLSNGRGLWGTGPFKEVSCVKSTKTKGRVKSKSDKEKWTWKLRASAVEKTRIFEIFYRDKNGNISLASTYTLNTEISTVFLMQNPTTAPLIAAHLSMGLPFSSTIYGSKINSDVPIIIDGKKLPALPAPKSPLQIFSLKRVGSVWQPKVFATGTPTEKSPSVLSIAIQTMTLEPGNDFESINPKTMYFAHQVADRDEARGRINEAIVPELSTLFTKFFDIGRSAYVGTRYGMPMGAGAGILAKSPMIGFFGEFRGGLLAGINFNYDYISKRKLATKDSHQEFAWSRLQFGYGFGRRIESSYFNWIDLTPKLGVTNLVLKSTPTEDSFSQGFDFHLNHAPTLGAELGFESRTNTFLYRAWGYTGFSLGAVKLDKKYNGRSTRAGFDVYKEVFELKKTKIALLGFAALDASTFSKNLTDEELAANPDETKSISYGSIYLGGGITLTW